MRRRPGLGHISRWFVPVPAAVAVAANVPSGLAEEQALVGTYLQLSTVVQHF